MLEKIKNLQKYAIWQQARDVRFLGFVVFGVMVLLASWSGVNVIATNYTLQKQISQLGQQNQVQQLMNSNLKLQNEYYNTDAYLELQARKQFGLGAPGETLLLVPKSVALAHAAALPDTTTPKKASQPADQPFYRQNFQAWLNFLLHRSS